MHVVEVEALEGTDGVELREVLDEAFALLGWTTLTIGGWRRGQVNLATAILVCGTLWTGESLIRVGFVLLAGAGMRLTLIPS